MHQGGVMNQKIIDRYNKGQDKYEYRDYLSSLIVKSTGLTEKTYISIYDFLFNPKWGFAKAFFGKELNHRKYDITKEPYFHHSGYLSEDEYHLQQMAIAPDVLEYLEEQL